MEFLNTHLTAALEKLADEQVEAVNGQKEKVMAGAVAGALRSFCRQSAEFSRAVANGGSFADCMAAVAKGVGQSISDVDAYKKAVGFYLPGADIRVQMHIDLGGEAAAPAPAAERKPELRVVKSASPFSLNLDDFL